MYEVMDSSFRGIKDNVAMYRAEIVVDTANDLLARVTALENK